MGFDRLARVYATLETLTFGGALARARACHLSRLAGRGGAVLLGDGDGRFLKQLLTSAFSGQVISVDSSPAMIRRAERKIGSGSGVEFCCQPVEEFVPPAGFPADAVTAHFFFDCLTDDALDRLLKDIGDWIAEDGFLVVSDFAIPASGWLRRSFAKITLWGMYRFFRGVTAIGARELPDIDGALRRRGWREIDRREWRGGFIFSAVWELGQNPDYRESP